MMPARRRMSRSRFTVRGRIEIQVFDAILPRDGRGRFVAGSRQRLAKRLVTDNLVVSGGLTWICERLRSNALNPISTYQLGTTATAPAPGQSALVASAYSAVVTKTNVAGPVLTVMLHLGRTQGNGPTYVEGGIFSADGTMLARGTFNGVSKVNTQTMTIVHTLTLSAS